MLLIGGRMTLRSVAASGCLIDSNDILGAYEYFVSRWSNFATVVVGDVKKVASRENKQRAPLMMTSFSRQNYRVCPFTPLPLFRSRLTSAVSSPRTTLMLFTCDVQRLES